MFRYTSFLLASVAARTSHATSAETALCDNIASFSGTEYGLTEQTSLSINGFKPSITYKSAQEGSSPKIRITAASEEPLVDLSSGTLTISSESCHHTTTSEPTGSPTTSSASKILPGLLSLPLLTLGGYAPLLLGTLFFLSSFAAADDTDACTPSVQIEIDVPYSCPYDNFVDGVCMTPRQIADLAVQALFVDFDVNAASALLAPDYIQHNPTVPTGAAPVLEFLPFLRDSGLAIETHRTLQEGNLIVYHSTYTNATLFGGDTLVGFDVFRVENGKLQEHWDNLQELDGPNPSGNTMVDGPTMVKYLGETEANKERAMGLVNGVLVGGDANVASLYISTEEYTQHNPTIADGLDGLATALGELALQNLTFAYDSIELVVAEGNFVLTGSPGEFGAGNPTAYYDLFRLEDGLIVEHWDVIQPIPPASEFAHSNGKF